MKHIVLSVVSVIAVLLGLRVLSPAAPEPVYHIAYLIARDVRFGEDTSPLPENLFKGLTAHKIDVAYSWDELLRIQTKQPIDALIIHGSALNMVDFEWVANAYWHGMTLSTVSVSPAMLGHLYDHACLPFGYAMPVPETGYYATISTNLILSQHTPDEIAKWFRRDWRRNCEYPMPVEATKATSMARRYTSGPLEKETIEIYQFILLDHIAVAAEAREEFKRENKEFQRLTIETLPQ